VPLTGSTAAFSLLFLFKFEVRVQLALQILISLLDLPPFQQRVDETLPGKLEKNFVATSK
jgi:hypothetical protein